MKLGDGYRQAQRWNISDITATKCRMPMYIQDVEDSTFTRLSLQGMKVDAGFDHCIYMSEGSFRLTFTDVTLIGGGGYGLHLYSSSGGPSSDITFNNLTVDARTGRQPMCIADGFSNITFNNLTSRMSVDEVHMRLSGCTNITFDGLNASGGDAFIGTWDGDTAGRVTIKNGNYDGPVLVSPDPGEQAIVDLIVENVTLGSPGESSYPR